MIVRFARWLLCLKGEHYWEFHPTADRCQHCGRSALATDFTADGGWISRGVWSPGGVPASWVGHVTRRYREMLSDYKK